jgi:hypothetical protein
MNRRKPHGLTGLTAVCVLAMITLATACGTSGAGGVSTVQPGGAADTGMAGCTALLGARQPAATEYPMIRSEFAGSHWADLRTAGLSYVELAVALRTARADAYETVWFYQRLSAACTRHGWHG